MQGTGQSVHRVGSWEHGAEWSRGKISELRFQSVFAELVEGGVSCEAKAAAENI